MIFYWKVLYWSVVDLRPAEKVSETKDDGGFNSLNL